MNDQRDDVRRHLRTARRALLKALKETEGVDFTPELRELMVDSLTKMRKRIDQLDAFVQGQKGDA